MNFLHKRHPNAGARGRRQSVLHLETLENRTLLTYFSVGQVPSIYTLEQATAAVRIGHDQGPVADVAVMAAAQPAGMGYQSGYFNSDGGQENALRIDTAPDPGQKLGDPIQVAFSYKWIARLETYDGVDSPPWESFVNSSASVTGGQIGEKLFIDSLSTTFTLAQQDGSTGRLVIPMAVGESVSISVSLNGEAHAAQPHYQTWVDFHAKFKVHDVGRRAVLSDDHDTALPTTALAPLAADALFSLSEHGLSWRAREQDPAAYPEMLGPGEAAERWSALRSSPDAIATTPKIVQRGEGNGDSPLIQEGRVPRRSISDISGIEEMDLMAITL